MSLLNLAKYTAPHSLPDRLLNSIGQYFHTFFFHDLPKAVTDFLAVLHDAITFRHPDYLLQVCLFVILISYYVVQTLWGDWIITNALRYRGRIKIKGIDPAAVMVSVFEDRATAFLALVTPLLCFALVFFVFGLLLRATEQVTRNQALVTTFSTLIYTLITIIGVFASIHFSRRQSRQDARSNAEQIEQMQQVIATAQGEALNRIADSLATIATALEQQHNVGSGTIAQSNRHPAEVIRKAVIRPKQRLGRAAYKRPAPPGTAPGPQGRRPHKRILYRPPTPASGRVRASNDAHRHPYAAWHRHSHPLSYPLKR